VVDEVALDDEVVTVIDLDVEAVAQPEHRHFTVAPWPPRSILMGVAHADLGFLDDATLRPLAVLEDPAVTDPATLPLTRNAPTPWFFSIQ
jgi:hypothetical protein